MSYFPRVRPALGLARVAGIAVAAVLACVVGAMVGTMVAGMVR